MRSRSIVRELVEQLVQPDAGDEHSKRMRKILKIRKYPDEDDDDPIDADPMRRFGSALDALTPPRDHNVARRPRTNVMRIWF